MIVFRPFKVSQRLHFEKRHQERQGGFRSLILIGPLRMQSVPATAGHRIVKWKLQIIVAEEPVESRPRLHAPPFLIGDAVGLQTSRYRSRGFDWLLIEARFLFTLPVETLRSNRNKVILGLAMLLFHQPIERFETIGDHSIVGARRPNNQQRLR